MKTGGQLLRLVILAGALAPVLPARATVPMVCRWCVGGSAAGTLGGFAALATTAKLLGGSAELTVGGGLDLAPAELVLEASGRSELSLGEAFGLEASAWYRLEDRSLGETARGLLSVGLAHHQRLAEGIRGRLVAGPALVMFAARFDETAVLFGAGLELGAGVVFLLAPEVTLEVDLRYRPHFVGGVGWGEGSEVHVARAGAQALLPLGTRLELVLGAAFTVSRGSAGSHDVPREALTAHLGCRW